MKLTQKSREIFPFVILTLEFFVRKILKKVQEARNYSINNNNNNATLGDMALGNVSH